VNAGAADNGPQALLVLVDPELRDFALQLRAMYLAFAPMSLEKLAERRALMGEREPAPRADIAIETHTVPGAAGHPDVRVHVIDSRPGESRGGILHMHGGGFTAGSAAGMFPAVQDIAKTVGCTIVTVDFRNAPETRQDGSLEDNYAGLRWMYANAEAIGVDRTRIAVMGESGGGGHAALLALAARDRGEIPLAFQALIYPMLDDRTGVAAPVPPHLDAFGWNADANRFSWRCFLGEEPGTQVVNPAQVPARVADLSGLPPAFIAVGALDLFVLEDVAYAQRLIEAGVPTELYVAPGAVHGFDLLAPDAAISRRFRQAKLEALRRALS
jgi:acetyl esterase/lipase